MNALPLWDELGQFSDVLEDFDRHAGTGSAGRANWLALEWAKLADQMRRLGWASPGGA